MNKFLFFATKNGLVKKTPLEEYSTIRQSGLVAVKLDQDDRLLKTQPTSGQDQVFLVTAQGKSILFNEDKVRPTGRATRGVKGIALKKGDYVIGMDVIRKSEKKDAQKKYEVLVITENGYGKKTALSEYKPQGRGGQGVFTARIYDKTGKLVDMRILRHDHSPTAPSKNKEKTATTSVETTDSHDFLVISQKGQTIRLSLDDIPRLGRQTQGVRIIKLNSGDQATAIAIL